MTQFEHILSDDASKITAENLNQRSTEELHMEEDGQSFDFPKFSSAFQIALALDKKECIAKFIQLGVKMNKNEQNQTEIHFLAQNLCEASVQQYFGKFEAQIDNLTVQDQNCLHFAAKFNNECFVNQLELGQLKLLLFKKDSSQKYPFDYCSELDLHVLNFIGDLPAYQIDSVAKNSAKFQELIKKHKSRVYQYSLVSQKFEASANLILVLSFFLVPFKPELAFLLYQFASGYLQDKQSFKKPILKCSSTMLMLGTMVAVGCVANYIVNKIDLKLSFGYIYDDDVFILLTNAAISEILMLIKSIRIKYFQEFVLGSVFVVSGMKMMTQHEPWDGIFALSCGWLARLLDEIFYQNFAKINVFAQIGGFVSLLVALANGWGILKDIYVILALFLCQVLKPMNNLKKWTKIVKNDRNIFKLLAQAKCILNILEIEKIGTQIISYLIIATIIILLEFCFLDTIDKDLKKLLQVANIVIVISVSGFLMK